MTRAPRHGRSGSVVRTTAMATPASTVTAARVAHQPGIAAGQWLTVALWFVVAIVGHDLLLFPLYSLADLSLRRLLPRRPGSTDPAATKLAATAQPQVINYIRVPAGFSVLLLVVWFPFILRLSSAHYHQASGLSADPYLYRWLAVTGVMFLTSAVSYALRLRHAAVKGSPPERPRRGGRGVPEQVDR